jgi:glycosyltransferase involved in cell wall biosynthesis
MDRREPLDVLLLNQFYPPSDAPTGLLLADLAERLAAAGHRVRVVASRRAYEDPRRTFPAREERAGVVVGRLPTLGGRRGGALARALDDASFLCGTGLALLAGRRPDVVVALSTPPLLATLAVLAARLRGARTVYWVMDVYPDVAFALGVLRADSVLGRLLSRLARYALVHATVVVALGERMAARLSAQAARSIEHVPNWLAGPEFPAGVDATELRNEWGWNGKLVVLYSGNLGRAYEFDTALRAASLLRDRADVRFAFVGRGARRGEIESEVGRLGLSNVELRDPFPRERLALGLAAADLHLVTLRPEAAGLVVPSKIYGTLAVGRPTLYVGPRESEIAGILLDAECGVRIEPGDAEALARAIRAYADDPLRRRTDGERARRLHEERFARGRSLEELVRFVEGCG